METRCDQNLFSSSHIFIFWFLVTLVAWFSFRVFSSFLSCLRLPVPTTSLAISNTLITRLTCHQEVTFTAWCMPLLAQSQEKNILQTFILSIKIAKLFTASSSMIEANFSFQDISQQRLMQELQHLFQRRRHSWSKQVTWSHCHMTWQSRWNRCSSWYEWSRLWFGESSFVAYF